MACLLKIRRFYYTIFIATANTLLYILPSSFLRVCLIRLLGGKVGAKTTIKGRVKIDFPWRLNIGSNCYISSSVYLDCRGGKIFVSDNADISEQSHIYTLSHDINSPDFCVKAGDVYIGERVWICFRAVVLPGSRIEDGCVIGANSVISGTTESNTLYQGVPCKKIKQLNTSRAKLVRSGK
ncbi:acyltransferase [Chromobacterium violaceum]|uniref:acyltransferase n=1 Tax=Chromobacterium violaceum TaxID=536 RepID=UPI00096E5502|nr:hypothetical protein BS642_13925 [Chromobacterium violaceum]